MNRIYTSAIKRTRHAALSSVKTVPFLRHFSSKKVSSTNIPKETGPTVSKPTSAAAGAEDVPSKGAKRQKKETTRESISSTPRQPPGSQEGNPNSIPTALLSESDLLEVVKSMSQIIPSLSLSAAFRKGDHGRIGVIGGCEHYTGAPYYSAMAALKTGADLVHVFCYHEASTAIKAYSPELIVHPTFREVNGDRIDKVVSESSAAVVSWLDALNVLVIGPGLGRQREAWASIEKIIDEAKKRKIPLIIDGDGLFFLSQHPAIIKDYPLCILTPNAGEYKRFPSLYATTPAWGSGVFVFSKADFDRIYFSNQAMAEEGSSDAAAEPSYVGIQVNLESKCTRRCGGQGDILTGVLATMLAWCSKHNAKLDAATPAAAKKEPAGALSLSGSASSNVLTTLVSASMVCRLAASDAFETHKRGTTSIEILKSVPGIVDSLFPIEE